MACPMLFTALLTGAGGRGSGGNSEGNGASFKPTPLTSLAVAGDLAGAAMAFTATRQIAAQLRIYN